MSSYISSFNIPEGQYDVNVLILKTNITHLLDIFNFLNDIEFSHINICDDYNPSVFSENDTTIAMNDNYRFKISLDTAAKMFTIHMQYGVIANTESFIDKLLKNITNNTKS